jgi:hypothetical protein
MKSIYPVAISALAFALFSSSADVSMQSQALVIPQSAIQLFEVNPGIDASGVAPIGDKTFLLVADNKNCEVVIVETKTRVVRKDDLRIPETSSCDDWEAMAKDQKKNFYLVNSHGDFVRFVFKDETLAEPNDFQIIVKPDQQKGKAKPFEKIKESFKEIEKLLGHSAEIEGLAVKDGARSIELFFGIRQKDVEVIHVCRAEITNDGMTTGLTPAFTFRVPKAPQNYWHLSSIEYVPEVNGFLLMTSSEVGSTFYGSQLWFVSDDQLASANWKDYKEITPKLLTPNPFGDKNKAEGIAVLDANGADLKVVIMFDNDSKESAMAEVPIPKSLLIPYAKSTGSPSTSSPSPR